MKEVIVTKAGEFTDYQGVKRQYIMAAISMPASKVVMTEEQLDNFADAALEANGEDFDFDYEEDIVKQVNLGISVVNYDHKGGIDKFDEELGKVIAVGKARKKPVGTYFVNRPGLINDTVVSAILAQEMKYFEQNPGSILAGYNDARDKFLKANEGRKQD